jgi:predicted dehydrogenase
MASMGRQSHVLIVGAGSIGERHLRCFQATKRARVSFVEIDAVLRSQIADRYNAVGYESLTQALEQASDLNVAVVATPAHLHLDQARQLLNAGVHTLIEKPLATDTAGAQEISELAAASRLQVGVAYVYRAQPALAAMRAALQSGQFGRPVELVVVSGQNFPTYRPAYRQTYYTRHASGGGAIQDAITHMLNAGEWLVGPIERLVADAAHCVLDGVEVEDTVHILARHGQVLGSYNLNQHQAPNESTLTVVCEGGTLRWEVHRSRWRWMSRPDEPWHDEPHPPLARDDVFITQANRFLDAVAGEQPLLCSFDEGLQTLRVNLAALKSVTSGSWEQVK